MELNKNVNDEGKNEIKLNRKLRTWHKYRNYCIAGGGIIVVLFICMLIFKGCGSGSGSKNESVTVVTTQATTADSSQTIEETTAIQAPTAQATTAAANNAGVFQIAGKASEGSFSSADYFSNSMFVGDSIMTGVSYYNYLDGSKVLSDGNITTDKLSQYTDSVKSANPDKLFIMVGLNDINYGTRSADDIVSNISSFVSSIKQDLPNAKVYVMSVLPVTSEFEAKTTVNVKQSAIDEVNMKLQESMPKINAGYIDAASAFKDDSGYMNTSYTGNGSNIYHEYYPFLLNGIAEAVK